MIYNAGGSLLRAFQEFEIHQDNRHRTGTRMQVLPDWQELLVALSRRI